MRCGGGGGPAVRCGDGRGGPADVRRPHGAARRAVAHRPRLAVDPRLLRRPRPGDRADRRRPGPADRDPLRTAGRCHDAAHRRSRPDSPGARKPGEGAVSGVFVIRAGSLSLRASRRSAVVCGLLAAALIALALWAFTLGSYTLSLGDLMSVMTGTARNSVRTVVLEWRAPRIVAAVVFGAALAVGGAVFQSLTRNPLGSPDVIGFTTGSYTGVVLMLLAGASSYSALAAGALAGGLITAFAVYLLAFRRGVRGFRLIIVGIAVGALLSSVNNWFSVKADVDTALRAAVWGAGSLSAIGWPAVLMSSALVAAVALVAPAAQRRMRWLELGDDTAAMLGVSVERTKLLLVVLGVAATAAVTAAAGPIVFVALAAPQIARRLTGRGSTVDLAGSALVGALLLLGADIAAQHAIPGVVLPTGAVTVCVGGAYLLVLLVRESRRGF
ncbi:iron-hydroxamate transporter permease subunit [Streptomyces filamentosus NRRL 15998]|uniref:Iron-hydroxamate transporter permease subunit n=2 Tax=Streptomyces TaxID=1883 RepID=D6AFU0_STRFL|nr:iron-hydroxamate transporter permease subunit [Streptomyces filamentosus NRRL 15998]